MDAAALDFFHTAPELLGLYVTVEEQVLARCPDAQITAQSSQIKFTIGGRGFFFVSLPLHRRKNWPARCLVLTFGLPDRLESNRIAQAVEPYPNRWTHHVLLTAPEQLDEELLGWITESCAFSRAKRGRRED